MKINPTHQIFGPDAVVVPVAMSKETYGKLLRLAELCNQMDGTDLEEEIDVPDLCEQAITYGLTHLAPSMKGWVDGQDIRDS